MSINISGLVKLVSWDTLQQRGSFVTVDRQTGWEPPAALIGANSYVEWVALYLASLYIYAIPVSSQIFRFQAKFCDFTTILSISCTCTCTQLRLSHDIALCFNRSLPYTGLRLTNPIKTLKSPIRSIEGKENDFLLEFLYSNLSNFYRSSLSTTILRTFIGFYLTQLDSYSNYLSNVFILFSSFYKLICLSLYQQE